MQKTQLSQGEITLAAVGVQEPHRVAASCRGGVELQRHGIHREITASQILLQGAGGDLGVGRSSGVVLPPG